MNNLSVILIMIPAYLITHLLTYNIQLISGSHYFYGIYTKGVVLEDEFKKRVDKGYKRNLNRVFLIVVLLMLLNEYTFKFNIAIAMTVTLTFYIAMSYVYLKRYYIEVKEEKYKYLVTHPNDNETLDITKRKVVVDTQFLNEKSKIKKKFTKLFGICIFLSVASIIYLIINYNALPDMIPTHWGPTGEADAFSPKNIKNVFMISFMDISVVLLMACMAIESIGCRIYLNEDNLEVSRKKAIKYINNIGYCFFFLTLSVQSIMTTIPVFMVNELNIPIALTMSVIFIPIIISIVLIYNYIMLSTVKSKQKYVNTSDSDDEKWIYGIFYYNKEDPAAMVEKRFGAGWTINMASPKGKFLILLTVVMLFGSLILPFI